MTIKKIQSLEADAMKHVAAYCRVSTQRDDGRKASETQKAIYTKFINDNPNWQLVKGTLIAIRQPAQRIALALSV